MTRRQERQTFADLVVEVRATVPVRGSGVEGVLDTGAETWRGPGGMLWRRVDELTPARAEALVREGALVAWDCCGCQGYCGLDWLDPAARERLHGVTPRLPRRKRSWGALSSWEAEGQPALVLVEGDVEWGRELA